MDYALAGGVILSGLTIVFVVLILLTLIMMLLGKMLGGAGQKKPPEPEAVPMARETPVAPVAPPAEHMQADGISDETVAVISAAVVSVLGNGAVVRGIACAKQPGKGGRSAWGMAGMQQNTNPF